MILDIKVEPTNPNHYCLPKEYFEEYGFKIYDGTYEELHPNYNVIGVEMIWNEIVCLGIH